MSGATRYREVEGSYLCLARLPRIGPSVAFRTITSSKSVIGYTRQGVVLLQRIRDEARVPI